MEAPVCLPVIMDLTVIFQLSRIKMIYFYKNSGLRLVCLHLQDLSSELYLYLYMY
ncbi:UNVERIFIED_CONTAM: hypothetical protein FKN15_009042 [Acipenser sinensis]